MRKPWKIAGLVLAGLVFLLALLFFLFSRNLAVSGRPEYEGKVIISGMIDTVEVCRDEYGIPHIFAQNEDDLYRATGYVMAQDRLWQMDLLRRVARGRLAEIFGRRFVETDLLLRALRFPEKARRVLDSTPPLARRAVEAFSEGVNAYIQTHKNRLPLEFRLLRYAPEPWEPEHSAYLIGYMGWDLAFAWMVESVIWELQEKLTGQPEKLAELLAEPSSPIFIYSGFSLPQENRVRRNSLPLPSSFSNLSFPLPPNTWSNQEEVNKKINNYIFTSKGNFFDAAEDISMAEPGSSSSKSIAFKSSLLEATRHLEDLGLAIFMGSNNWAITGEKSTTGKPLLANDMHLALSLPGIWYPIHQSVERSLKVSGVALPGEPFVVAGHNEHIAWGMTNAMADDMDFYLETIDPARPDHYLFEGKWRPIEIRNEVIAVRGEKPVTSTLRFTHRGPIVSEFKKIKDKAVSMRWVGNEDSNELLAVYLLNRAKNWSEFRAALRFFRSLSQNVIYADTAGNIGLQLAGGIPRRHAPGWNLLPGETSAYDWPGLIPFEELPYVFNPSCGYVFSANNKSIDETYPYSISYFYLAQDRAERIQEFLSSPEKLSPQDLARLQADVQSKLVARLKPLLSDILDNLQELSELEKEAAIRLKAWDGVMSASRPEPTIFELLYFELSRQWLADELGEELFRRFMGWASRVFLPYFLEQSLARQDSLWADDLSTPEVKETIKDIVLRSFRQTVNHLRQTKGDDIERWTWGKLHQLTLRHALGEVSLLNFIFKLNRGPFPVGGSSHTVCPFGYSPGSSFRVNHGASQRHIYVVGSWDDSLAVIPAGVSGVPSSHHYADQIPLYLNNKYRHDFFTADKIKSSVRYRLLLTPN